MYTFLHKLLFIVCLIIDASIILGNYQRNLPSHMFDVACFGLKTAAATFHKNETIVV
jgi:hypothetical protein